MKFSESEFAINKDYEKILRNKIAVQEIICLDVAFYLLHRLGAELRIERFIIIYQFLERIYIIGLRIDKLAAIIVKVEHRHE